MRRQILVEILNQFLGTFFDDGQVVPYEETDGRTDR